MIFGIDFGSTFTLVAYEKNGKKKFVKFFNQRTKFLKTDKIVFENFKRYIENNSNNLQERNFVYKHLLKFFAFLKKNIEKKFGKIKIECVLTIPVRFNDFSRNLIKKAAFECEIFVLKLLYEPVAAALSFAKNNGTYLVYDLGGGTFDLTVIKKIDDIFDVVKVEGLSNFGGTDIDELIAKEMGVSKKHACVLKEKFALPKQILQKINEMLEKTFQLTKKIAKDEEIETLILTGGSSKLPCIKDYFQNCFKKVVAIDFQKSVVIGALIHAKNFTNNLYTLIDVIPFNLGIEILNGGVDVFVHENSPIPIKITKEFESVSVETVINVVQGNFENYISLARFVLPNFVGSFFIQFFLDADGILFVKVFNETQNFVQEISVA